MASSDIKRLNRLRCALIVAKSEIEVLAADAKNAYIALGAAGRGGPARIEKAEAKLLADLTAVINTLAEDEMAYEDGETRGDSKSPTDLMIRKRAILDRKIAQRLEKETARTCEDVKAQ
jgi:hypothetical protein